MTKKEAIEQMLTLLKQKGFDKFRERKADQLPSTDIRTIESYNRALDLRSRLITAVESLAHSSPDETMKTLIEVRVMGKNLKGYSTTLGLLGMDLLGSMTRCDSLAVILLAFATFELASKECCQCHNS